MAGENGGRRTGPLARGGVAALSCWAIFAAGCGAAEKNGGDVGQPTADAEPSEETSTFDEGSVRVSDCKPLPLDQIVPDLEGGVLPVAAAAVTVRGAATPELEDGVEYRSAELDNGEIATWAYVESRVSEVGVSPEARELSAQGSAVDLAELEEWGVGPGSEGYARSRECVGEAQSSPGGSAPSEPELKVGDAGSLGPLELTLERFEQTNVRDGSRRFEATIGVANDAKEPVEPFCGGKLGAGAALVDTLGRPHLGNADVGFGTPNCERLAPGESESGYVMRFSAPEDIEPAVLELSGGTEVTPAGEVLVWDVSGTAE